MEPEPSHSPEHVSKFLINMELYEAALNNNLVTVNDLLMRGADPSAYDDGGWSAMHSACGHGNLQMMEVLFQAGADILAVNKLFETPLHAACYGLHRHAMRWLLDNGADPYARDASGWTPLRWMYQREREILDQAIDRQKEEELSGLMRGLGVGKTQIHSPTAPIPTETDLANMLTKMKMAN